MANIRLELEFDGGSLFGWQYQPNRPTVQGHLELALRELYGCRIGVTGAGRTDTGVSAINYTASFFAPRAIEPRVVQNALNDLLPKEIRVRRARLMADRFSARHSARARSYRYTIVGGRSPLLRSRAWEVDYRLDKDRMTRAARLFVGEHDFASFCRLNSRRGVAAGDEGRSTRDDFGISISEIGHGRVQVVKSSVRSRRCTITGLPLIQIEFEANRFLYKMVRRMVGALVDIGRGKFTSQDLEQAINDRPLVQFSTAPAHGLLFVRARYR